MNYRESTKENTKNEKHQTKSADVIENESNDNSMNDSSQLNDPNVRTSTPVPDSNDQNHYGKDDDGSPPKSPSANSHDASNEANNSSCVSICENLEREKTS